jgi:hypothetical protein
MPLADRLSGSLNAPVARGPLTLLCDACAWALLTALAIIAWLTFADYGLGWDDYTHSQYGQLLLDYYASGFADRRALTFVNLYMYGGGFDMLAAMIAKALPFGLFETRRLMGAVVGLAGMIIVWRLARRIGGPISGLIALMLIAATPLFYGHMFINAKDAPFAMAMTLLLFGLVRALDEYPRPGAATIAIFGIGLGLALGTRIMGGMTALYMVLPMAVVVGHDMRSQGLKPAANALGVFVLRLVPGLLLAYAVMALVWPWSVIDPLNPIRAIGYFSQFFEEPWEEMFGGQIISVPDMPRSYLPTYLILKMPEVLLLLSAAGLVGVFAAQARAEIPAGRRAALLLIAMAAVIPIMIAIATRPAMYNGIRHFLFLLPPICVLGGVAGGTLLRWLSERSRVVASVAAVAMLAALSLPVSAMIALHPYQYTYFNTVSGGIRAANKSYMLHYWGLSF